MLQIGEYATAEVMLLVVTTISFHRIWRQPRRLRQRVALITLSLLVCGYLTSTVYRTKGDGTWSHIVSRPEAFKVDIGVVIQSSSRSTAVIFHSYKTRVGSTISPINVYAVVRITNTGALPIRIVGYNGRIRPASGLFRTWSSLVPEDLYSGTTVTSVDMQTAHELVFDVPAIDDVGFTNSQIEAKRFRDVRVGFEFPFETVPSNVDLEISMQSDVAGTSSALNVNANLNSASQHLGGALLRTGPAFDISGFHFRL